MARRNGGGAAAVLVVDDWTTTWRCACGYTNSGRERCLMCGAKAPVEVQDTPGLRAEAELPDPVLSRGPEPKAGRSAWKTVALIILLNLVIQVIEVVVFIAADVETITAIRISLFTGLAYYTFAALWAMARSAELGVRPRVRRGKTLVGAAEGFIVGGALAVFLFAVIRLIEGRPVLDPTVTSFTAQGSFGSLLLGILLVAVAAPVVEELVFRGFLAQALEGRGRRVAVMSSAVAFSLAHLRLAQFRYYLAMGAVLALIYFRRGLVGSVAAHATFNGMLILLAVVASHGPATEVTAGGATVTVPPTYQVSTSVLGDHLEAVGPLGARMNFTYVDVDGVPTAPLLARAFASGTTPPPPGVVVDLTSVIVLDLPVGQAVSMSATVEEQEGRMVFVPTPGRLWVATYESDGTHRSAFEFDEMLRSWRLPPIAG